MSITIVSHRISAPSLQQRYGDAHILDVTSNGSEPWVRFSPFYPHGGIPIPFSSEMTSASVEGIWQGLKVFEHADIDPVRFTITSMRGIKRTARAYGQVLGHRAGVNGVSLLSYIEARKSIYLPSYHWILEHRLQMELAELQRLAGGAPIILLDYETNCDIDDPRRPLSHAGLVKRYIENEWPQ